MTISSADLGVAFVSLKESLSPQDIEQIFDLHRKGRSCREIAKQLNLSKSAVHKTV